MDVIKRLAQQFSNSFMRLGYTLEKFSDGLETKLIYINNKSEKLRFLSYLKDIAETKYKEHAPVCPNPNSCATNQSLENVIYCINQEYDNYLELVDGVDLAEKPAMHFYTEGQYFDAFSEIKEKIKEAKKSIVLVDAYVNNDTLIFFSGKDPKIKLRILTDKKSIDLEFERAVILYNKQYENLQYNISNNFHDRFLILDDKVFYHIGASIKDAGNKTFMFTRIRDENVMNTIRIKIEQEWNSIYK